MSGADAHVTVWSGLGDDRTARDEIARLTHHPENHRATHGEAGDICQIVLHICSLMDILDHIPHEAHVVMGTPCRLAVSVPTGKSVGARIKHALGAGSNVAV